MFKVIEPISFPQVSVTSIDEACPKWAHLIKMVWSNPEDYIDFGGGVSALPYHMVYNRGRDHLWNLIKAVPKRAFKKHPEIIDEIWVSLEAARSEESSLYP